MGDNTTQGTLVIKLPALLKMVLQDLAQIDGESISSEVRKLVRTEAQRRGMWYPTGSDQKQPTTG